MIAAYDSSEAMELKYWVDDTNQVKKKESEQDLEKLLYWEWIKLGQVKASFIKEKRPMLYF